MPRRIIGLGLMLIASIAIAMLAGPAPDASDPLRQFVLYSVRAPRVLVCGLVGSALAMAGALSQGFFRNDLADPSIIGVGLSAALGAVMGFILHVDQHFLFGIPLLSMMGAGGHLLALLWLRKRVPGTAGLLLAGIAIGAMSSAAISVLHQLSMGDFALQRRILGWLFGSFEGLGWPHALVGIVTLLVAFPLLFRLRGPLDDLLLGSDMAERFGTESTRLSALVLGVLALLVGVSAALVGAVGFVGLIVPHIGRLLLGARHGRLLWFSGLAGATLLILVDALLRVAPVYLAPGVVMSALGAPFFLWLLLRGGQRV